MPDPNQVGEITPEVRAFMDRALQPVRRPKYDLYRRYDLSLDKLRAAIKADPAVRAEASAELVAVALFADGGRFDGRSVISKEYAAILEQALSE